MVTLEAEIRQKFDIPGAQTAEVEEIQQTMKDIFVDQEL